MAYWYRKNGKYVTVYFEHPDTGVQTQLKRKATKHLDRQPDQAIELWVEEWARLNEAKEARRDTIGATPEQENAFKGFLLHLEKEDERARNTLRNYRRWLKWAVEYFREEPLASWPKTSRGFGTWLLSEKRVSESETKAANRAIAKFWRWAEEEELPGVEGVLKVKGGKKRYKPTPLQRTMTPDEALALAWRAPSPFNLMVLVGYFMSLRPQETFALTPDNFLAGKEAAALECNLVLGQHGLYNRLAYYVEEQIVDTGDEDDPKDYSFGWVGCFDERAARLIIRLLENFTGFDKKPNHYYNLWRQSKASDFTLKDLRRASIYWLGHYTTLPPGALQNHARHQSIETTQLYMRRPGEGPREAGGKRRLSLDD